MPPCAKTWELGEHRMPRQCAQPVRGTNDALDRRMIRVKRAYEPAGARDGHRVLVERLWPRGLRKADAHIETWLKDVAPSDELRRWFGHDPSRFSEFRERYTQELRSERARTALAELARQATRGTVTLVYSAHDVVHNNAVVLARMLARRIARTRSRHARPARTVHA